MAPQDAARIQSSQAKNGGDMSSKGFPSRAQAAAAHNTNAGESTGSGNNSSGSKNNSSARSGGQK